VTNGADQVRHRLEKLRRDALAAVAAVGRAPEAEAETTAAAAGRLDPGVHDALMGIERLKADIALKASESELTAVKLSIERLKNWAMGAAITALLAFILFLLNLLSRLVASSLVVHLPPVNCPV
jgi:hypothetical protein